jgi:hypothetical protein
MLPCPRSHRSRERTLSPGGLPRDAGAFHWTNWQDRKPRPPTGDDSRAPAQAAARYGKRRAPRTEIDSLCRVLVHFGVSAAPFQRLEGVGFTPVFSYCPRWPLKLGTMPRNRHSQTRATIEAPHNLRPAPICQNAPNSDPLHKDAKPMIFRCKTCFGRGHNRRRSRPPAGMKNAINSAN